MSYQALLVCTLLLNLFRYSAANEQWRNRRTLLPKPPARKPAVSDNLQKEAETHKSGNTTFTQYIDHSNRDLGTFEQFYYWSSEYWGGPGFPVVFMTPGESAAAGYDGYLENTTLTGHFAQVLNAAVIVMEHRYWGQSIPVPDFSTENMKYLTVNQSLADFENFALSARLPFDDTLSSNANNAPWVMSGGSYAGTLAFNMAAVKPGTFWAYTSSSGPAEAIYDFYGYFDPIREHMPKNCSADLQKVISHIDSVLINGTNNDQLKLLTDFGAQTMAHKTDFASALTSPLALWQSNQFYGGYSDPFYQFCDAVEGVSYNSTLPAENGVGFTSAYRNFASYMKQNYFYDGVCGNGNDLSCYDTYNSSSYSDISLTNEYRQFEWLLCNEPYAGFQDGAPEGHPTIVSRLVTADYNRKACSLYFPESASGIKPRLEEGYSVDVVNSYFGGWDNFDTERLLYVTGSADPFRDQGVSSIERPGGPRHSTKKIPIFEIDGGYHVTDLIMPNAEANENVQKVVDAETAQLVEWVKEWPGYSSSNSTSSISASAKYTQKSASYTVKQKTSGSYSTCEPSSKFVPKMWTSSGVLFSSNTSMTESNSISVFNTDSSNSTITSGLSISFVNSIPMSQSPSAVARSGNKTGSLLGVSPVSTYLPCSTNLNGITRTVTANATFNITSCSCTLPTASGHTSLSSLGYNTTHNSSSVVLLSSESVSSITNTGSVSIVGTSFSSLPLASNGLSHPIPKLSIMVGMMLTNILLYV